MSQHNRHADTGNGGRQSLRCIILPRSLELVLIVAGVTPLARLAPSLHLVAHARHRGRPHLTAALAAHRGIHATAPGDARKLRSHVRPRSTAGSRSCPTSGHHLPAHLMAPGHLSTHESGAPHLSRPGRHTTARHLQASHRATARNLGPHGSTARHLARHLSTSGNLAAHLPLCGVGAVLVLGTLLVGAVLVRIVWLLGLIGGWIARSGSGIRLASSVLALVVILLASIRWN